MYKIIGADQKEYGPVSADQLRQWIRDGRVNAHTRARPESGGDWQPLSAFPEFADVFQPGVAAPPPAPPSFAAPSATGSPQSAIEAVKGPAICIIVMAALGIAVHLFSAVMHLVGNPMMDRQIPNMPPQFQAYMQNLQGPVGLVLGLVGAALNAVTLFGGIKMMRLQSHGFAMVACILTMLPVSSCCCPVGLAFGIWGLVVISKPEVKSHFT
jgi:hypothetical protein